MTTRITRSERYDAKPDQLYELLTDSSKFSSMTGGAPTDIDSTPGGAISMFGGMITGRTIEAVPGERLVQAWRPGLWEQGVYSIVRFDIEADGDGARLSLDHTGFPEGLADSLTEGWDDNYFGSIRTAVSAM